MPYGISEIAGELKLSDAELRAKLFQMGFEIAGKASTLSDEMVDALRADAAKQQKPKRVLGSKKSIPQASKPVQKVEHKEEAPVSKNRVILVKKNKPTPPPEKPAAPSSPSTPEPSKTPAKSATSTTVPATAEKKSSGTQTSAEKKPAGAVIRRQIHTVEELRASARKMSEEDRALEKLKKLKEQKSKQKNVTKLSSKDVKNETAATVNEGEAQLVAIPKVIVVKELAQIFKLPVTQVIAELLKNGVIATLNDQIDYETAAIIGADLGFKIEEAKEEVEHHFELDLATLVKEDNPKKLVPRAPVISVIGHVDHGKTKLLDCVRGTQVAEGEAGGITQKIGAYQVEKKGKKITFLDTPGHEAFTSMRARGVKSTDIAILVVAADDGVKPQTIEAINHAKAANVPIVVAINKIDKEGANPDKVKKQLAENGVMVEGWGGDTVCAQISAKQGTGIDELLDMVLLVADMQNLKANPARKAVGTVIEARLDQRLGPVATVLVHTGTLKLREDVVIGTTYGKVRQLYNFKGESVKEAGPSVPVLVSGLVAVPKAGDILYVVLDAQEAKVTAAKISEERNANGQRERSGLSEATKQIREGNLKELPIIIKADSKGSVEAIRSSLAKLPSNNAAVKVLHSAAGEVTDSDVMIASVSHAIILAFTTKVPLSVQKRAELAGVEIRTYNVIYKLIEDIEQALLGLLEPETVEVPLGELTVKAIFFTGKGEQVVGGEVSSGWLEPNSKVRVYRGAEMVGEGAISDLHEGPEKVKKVEAGQECGLRFKGAFRIKEGDELEVYKEEQKVVSL